MIVDYFKESVALKSQILGNEEFLAKVQSAIDLISNTYKNGNKVLIAGNGGSAADAQHFAGEIVCTFMRKDRRGFPAIALTTDTSIMTAWSNDFSFDTVFSRQVEAHGNPGDIFLGISTSGNSANILSAVSKAKDLNLKTIGFLGKDGGKMKGLFDIELIVPSSSTPRIQEVHTLLVHIICEEVEKRF